MNVIIIFNPNSTGDSEANARILARELRATHYADLKVSVRETTHAGHGEEIARAYAEKGEEVILVSSSGDGGYHELINGALSSEKSRVICGLLPSGNANDHHSSLSNGHIATDILDSNFQQIDTLKITSTVKGRPWTRYAHSYAGIGISSVAAKDMTAKRPNILSEKWLVLKSIVSFNYVKIRVDGDTKRYSSIIFSNIPRMSKVLKLSDKQKPTDGKFEVNTIRFRAKLWLVIYAFRASTSGLKQYRSVKSYSFETVRALLIQLDGESYTIDSRSKVVVESVKQNLCCVL